jgi:hypothetical protein
MKPYLRLTVYALWCFSMSVVGCQSSDDAVTLPAEPIITPPVDQPSTHNDNDPKETPGDADANQLAAEEGEPFTPPFPDRIELFVPPKRAQVAVQSDDENDDSIELKGFVNVGRPQVVLAIDGVISPIAEGNERFGVRVISIQQPSVVLQRGRNRWTATLE